MKQYLTITLILLSIILTQCFEFETINQPSYSNPNTAFYVAISVKLDQDISQMTPLFGILLPNGWSVKDDISCSGSYEGTLNYSKEYSDSMEIVDPAPDAYYWWVCIGSKADANVGPCSFTPQITTDDKTGQFSIRYTIADHDNIEDRRSENHPIWIWVGPPEIVVTPDSLFENLTSGQTSEQAITIENTGIYDLHFTTSTGWKSALQFDGEDDYIEIPISAFNNLPAGCVEFWINASSFNTEILYKETYFGETISGLRINNDGTIQGSHMNFWGENVISNASLLRNKWYHIAWTWDGTVQKIYLNGELDIIESCHDGVANHLVGWVRWGRGDSFFKGIIDDVRIWNIARTQPDIQANMHQELTGNEPGLIGYWQFNEGVGSIAMDLSSNNNEGVLHEGTVWTESSAPVLNWLSSSIPMGIVKKDSSLDISVIFKAETLSTGIYDANVEISSNDPLNPNIRVPIKLKVDPITGFNEPLANELPNKFVLSQNYPNPFNPSTVISYSLPSSVKSETLPTGRQAANVRLIVFDILGREVVTLVNQKQNPGSYEVTWDGLSASGGQVPSGVYFYQLTNDNFVETKKMILLR